VKTKQALKTKLALVFKEEQFSFFDFQRGALSVKRRRRNPAVPNSWFLVPGNGKFFL